MKLTILFLLFCFPVFSQYEKWGSYDIHESYNPKTKSYELIKEKDGRIITLEILFNPKTNHLLFQDSVKQEIFYYTITSSEEKGNHSIYTMEDQNGKTIADFYSDNLYNTLLINTDNYTSRYRRKILPDVLYNSKNIFRSYNVTEMYDTLNRQFRRTSKKDGREPVWQVFFDKQNGFIFLLDSLTKQYVGYKIIYQEIKNGHYKYQTITNDTGKDCLIDIYEHDGYYVFDRLSPNLAIRYKRKKLGD